MTQPNSLTQPNKPSSGQKVTHWMGHLFKTPRPPAEMNFLSLTASSGAPRPEAFAALLTLLQAGEMEIQGPTRFGSNEVYYAFISAGGRRGGGVYKPVKGEAPLADFPVGTLAGREVAAFLVSEALGWRFVPPTVYRLQAAYGPGALQLYIPTPPDFYHLKFTPNDTPALRRVALFDWLINNADRKAGHILPGSSGELWLIDQGLCFHPQFKLKTFLGEFEGQAIPPDLLNDVAGFRQRLDSDYALVAAMGAFLAPPELSALRHRADKLLTMRLYLNAFQMMSRKEA